jgi:hypothetical protein
VCWRRDGALVGNSACDAGASVCGGRWIVACGVCSGCAAPLRLPVLLGDFSGAGLSFEGRGGCEAGCAVGAVRTRGCGWGIAGRAVWADGLRMRGADTRTGYGRWALLGRVRLRSMGWHDCAGCGSCEGICEIGVGVGRGLRVRWSGGCGRARMAAAGKGGSAAAWAERCGWIGCGLGFGMCVAGWWCDACAGGGTGLWSGTRRAMRARPCAAAVGSWLVLCAARTRPLCDLQFCWATSRGRACLLRGRGDARRDAPW